jgi:hypothetical protein
MGPLMPLKHEHLGHMMTSGMPAATRDEHVNEATTGGSLVKYLLDRRTGAL